VWYKISKNLIKLAQEIPLEIPKDEVTPIVPPKKKKIPKDVILEPQMPPQLFNPTPVEQSPIIEPQAPVEPPMRQIEPIVDKPDDGKPDIPNQIELTPEEQNIIALQPPLHDRCHCSIETLPGGRQIWKTHGGSCVDCQNLSQQFNSIQSKLYGI